MTNDNPLENLEFFDSFSVDDPFEDVAEDPNANVKPDILNGEDYDPLNEEEAEPAAIQPSNPLLGKLLDVQSELESLDPACEKLPALLGNWTDGQFHILINKKKAAITAIVAKQKGKGTAENSHSASQE